ncbi:MAG: hypothetical protein ACI4A8_05230 [Muribaculaceae bacterium]
MKTLFISLLGIAMGSTAALAQIGYQVAIIDQSTGKPKTNETVAVTVTLSNNEGATIFSDTQNSTTNEFGVISLQIGNDNTFNDVDWSKLPLWVSASVDGVTVGKTQVLNVPVAEYAKHFGTLTREILTSKTWGPSPSGSFTFNENGTATKHFDGGSGYRTYDYYISGNQIVLISKNKSDMSYSVSFQYLTEIDALWDIYNRELYK